MLMESTIWIQMYKAGNCREKPLSQKKQRKTVKGVYLLDKSKILKKEIVYSINQIYK